MGNVAHAVPRAVLVKDVQLHFKALKVQTDIRELVTTWLQDGAPLGLDLEMFRNVLCLQGDSEKFFEAFDNDKNGKVDVLEVLSAAAVLAQGSLDEKVEVLVLIFDFCGAGQLSFDEVNILVHSVYRGLSKVCTTPNLPDKDIIDVCRQLFDAHNLPGHQTVSREQLRRWLKSDIDAAGFIDIFHNACVLPDAESVLAKRERHQANIFSSLCSTTPPPIPVVDLASSDALRGALGGPSDADFEALLDAMSASGAHGSVSLEHFLEATRAFNVFEVLDPTRQGSLHAKELRVLLWLHTRMEPPDDAVKKMWASMGLAEDSSIQRASWVRAVLRESP